VSLREVEGAVDDSWQSRLAGSLDRFVVDSQLLEGNPLGDPPRRPLYVYRPPGWEAHSEQRLSSVYLLQGFAGQLEEWLAPNPPSASVVECLDSMFATEECPPAVIVFVDAWTSRGGSQFLNSSSTGRYLDYLCDEVVPFVDARYATRAAREHRGLAGKSSGGYGALVLSMLRPDLFGALASQAGDALFECCYQPLFPVAARMLRDQFEGSWEMFHERTAITNELDWKRFAVLFAAYGLGCAYSPDPERPGAALMPFEIATGRPINETWERWLALDPVRMAEGHAAVLSSMRRIYLDAGRQDEFFLDLGAQALSGELTRLGIEHTLELFDGTHDGIALRQPGAIRELVLALDTA
jgi:enterochelin esterase-like enzyme